MSNFRSLTNDRPKHRKRPATPDDLRWYDCAIGTPKILTQAEARELLRNSPPLEYGYSENHIARRWKHNNEQQQ